MDVSTLCLVLQGCLSPDLTTRKHAEQELGKIQHTNGNLPNLLRVAVEESLDTTLRQVAAIQIKNIVKRGWDPSEGDSPIPAADKQALRDNLLEGLIRAPHIVQVQLGECMKNIVLVDFPEQWPSLLPQLAQNLHSQEQQRLYGALYALRLMTRKYEFRDAEERTPLETVVQTTFPTVLQVFQGLLQSGSHAEIVAELLKLICKAFWSATYMGIPDMLIQQDHFVGWMTCIHTLMDMPVPKEGQPQDPDARAAWSWWKAKKWVLHITYRLFNRYGDPKAGRSGADGDFIVLFSQQCSLKFLEAHMKLMASYSQGEWLSPRVLNLALQYLSHALTLSATWKHMKQHTNSLLTRCVLPLMCFNDEDDELWRDDPHEYIRKGYDIIEDMYSPKTSATNFVHELCTCRAKENLAPLLQLVTSTFDVFSAAQRQGTVSQEIARQTDGVLLAVGALSNVLKKKAPYKNQLEGLLLNNVMPCFDSPFGHLRAKACWVAGQYAEIEFRDGGGRGPVFGSLFQKVVNAFQDPDLPVRVDAVVALRSFIDAFDTEGLQQVKPLIPQLLDVFFQLMQEVENEDLIFTLETLVERFDEEMAPYAVGLTQHLAAAFWRMQASDEAEDDEDIGALAAFGCLRALSTVLESVSRLPQMFPQLEEILFPIMQAMCSEDGQDVFEEILEMISYFTYFSPEISARMWSLWPLLYKAFKEWAREYLDNILVPLNNFISKGTEVFLACKSPDYLAQASEMACKTLEDEKLGEEEVQPAPKLLEVILQNCRGRVDNYLPHYLQASPGYSHMWVWQKLPHVKEWRTKDLLISVIASALYYNNTLTISLLQQQNQLPAFLTTWGKMIFASKAGGSPQHFRQMYVKKVNLLGLISLLTLPEEATPPPVQAAWPQLMAGTMRLLTTLKEQQDENAHLNGGTGSDSASEVAESDPDDDADDAELSDDQDEEVDDAYMQQLAREARKLKGERHADEESSEDEWSDAEDTDTPIDSIDPFIVFADTIRQLQASAAPRFQALTHRMDAASQIALQSIMQYGDVTKAKAQS
ncbi:hypothetical protein ABBQ32_004507 [Trebouxia sp. C0010 RCD-2024]